ncbi:hypothetical protein TPHA_0E03270 [Tetrapisispora phaffii CBS 4417]|uniref:Cell wall mannoprotein PIR1-like C-terminal domain-containing protein n=1 Tax=Tetrapisispora phaffii (strain ATCC 24235 / CBS 4417 / NBRC 1672 / NRRL Y-8282 / UCD 70-5) TaxID=1071381 RepID=G8BU39_TETPH|nr:hypothetical protein TPHA_0E03270 [Tetrapisispora phaffii CBS 4417]CCE63417.1 hypothetical protein TPHA_0E03270 [Tetrapisispora phaffii CBS 4417]
MQLKQTLATTALASTALAAYNPSEPWTTLTPSATYAGGYTDYSASFGIAVQPIASSVAKRAEAISQIGDGQIQATTKTTTSAAKSTAAAVSQIGDGQIQATTKTTTSAAKSTAAAVSQIGDGQIQATTSTKATAAAVSQIGDGQVQATTSSAKSSAAAASQINDGQVQASTTKATTTLEGSSSSSSAATSTSTSAATTGALVINSVSCSGSGTLALSLKGGELTDAKGRIGSIVANRQFQFDGPPPQAGAIYAAGWSITPEGNLAIGDNDIFYQCLSGNFYNLYDETLGAQCNPVHLEIVDLVDC